MNTKRIKQLVSELDKLKWSENLDDIYKCLKEIDYLLYKHQRKSEYIEDIVYNITKFYWEQDFLKKREAFNLIKHFCNILNRHIL